MQPLREEDYRLLLSLRTGLRRFLHWSEQQAKKAGLTARQHQLLLAIRGHAPGRPSIGDVGESLLLRHHSTVELVDRAVAAGLVRRAPDDRDLRVVRLELTDLGQRRLAELSAAHLEELRRLHGTLEPVWEGLLEEEEEE